MSTDSANMPWHDGPPLLSYLEGVAVEDATRIAPFRMPVQWVNRPNLDFRGFSGFISGGNIQPGDIVRVLPSGRDTRVARIVTFDGDLESAVSGQSATLTLTEEIDISRGDLLCSPVSPAKTGDRLEARLLWLVREPLVVGKSYLLKLGTKTAPAAVTAVDARIDIETGLPQPLPEGSTLAFNEIGGARLSLETVIACDPYGENRETGGFILIDRITNETVAVGMVKAVAASNGRVAPPLTELSYASMEGLPLARESFRPTPTRSLVKALSWLLPASISTFLIVYAFVQSAALAAEITGVEMIAIFALYYFHERFWSRLNFGLGTEEAQGNDDPGAVHASVGFVPIDGGARIDFQRHGKMDGGRGRLLHDAAREFDRRLGFIVRRFEHKLVMHLQKHLRRETGVNERVIHPYHGASDDVRGRALDRRVDRRALIEGAVGRIGRCRCRGSGRFGRKSSRLRPSRAPSCALNPCSRECRESVRNSA